MSKPGSATQIRSKAENEEFQRRAEMIETQHIGRAESPSNSRDQQVRNGDMRQKIIISRHTILNLWDPQRKFVVLGKGIIETIKGLEAITGVVHRKRPPQVDTV